MPQDVEFALPWPLRVNPHLEAARAHNLQWMAAYGFLAAQTESAYLGWQLAEVSAYFYPDASLEGLCLATDVMGWYFTPFDDRFDGPLGQDPRGTARLCARLIDVLDGNPPVDVPVVQSFAEIWQRWQRGRSTIWCARAACNWAEYLAVHITEAQLRSGHLDGGSETQHMWRRRRSVSSGPLNDLAERAGGFEVPPLAWHSQILHEMRAVAADVVSLSNDTASAEKEARADDFDNNILLRLRQEGLTDSRAVTEIQHRTRALVRHFLTLEERCVEFARAFPPQQRTAVERHILALHDFMRGNDHWERTSGRYE
ncbi:pentalenene synthase [Streptomyces sp. NPDC050355]|uniref:terpene synthase family protein n=1 Tax=Streptomyces sp. NPDC050355 TaxID=3365609 RepID=UPI0037A59F92